MALVLGAHVAQQTGVPLWHRTRHGWVQRWDDPPACWDPRPLLRLTLFEVETAAGRLDTMGVD